MFVNNYLLNLMNFFSQPSLCLHRKYKFSSEESVGTVMVVIILDIILPADLGDEVSPASVVGDVVLQLAIAS